MNGLTGSTLLAVDASTSEQWLIIASGLGFLALLAVAAFVALVRPTGTYPSPFSEPAQIERFFSANRPQVQALAVVQTLASGSFLAFTASSTALLLQTAGTRTPFFWVALAAGAVAGSFVLLTALFVWTLSRPAIEESPPLLRALHDLAYIAGGPAHVFAVALYLGASSLAILSTSILPDWVAWLGLTGTVVSAPVALTMIWHPAAWILPITRILLASWILSICYQVAI